MPRTTLTKDAIVAAAFDELEASGLAGVTARAVAKRLRVQAGALYYHLPDMAALNDEMATAITRRMLVDADRAGDLPWDALLRAHAERMRSVLLEYRDGARLFAGTHLTDLSLLTDTEAALRVLTDAGFSLTDAQRGFQTMASFVVGHVIEEQHRTDAGSDVYDPGRRREQVDPDAAPLTVAASAAAYDEPGTVFSWGVETIIAGIGASLPAERRPPPGH